MLGPRHTVVEGVPQSEVTLECPLQGRRTDFPRAELNATRGATTTSSLVAVEVGFQASAELTSTADFWAQSRRFLEPVRVKSQSLPADIDLNIFVRIK